MKIYFACAPRPVTITTGIFIYGKKTWLVSLLSIRRFNCGEQQAFQFQFSPMFIHTFIQPFEALFGADVLKNTPFQNLFQKGQRFAVFSQYFFRPLLFSSVQGDVRPTRTWEFSPSIPCYCSPIRPGTHPRLCQSHPCR